MNKYNELKNFIDNFVEKIDHHLIESNDKNIKSTLKKIDGDKKILFNQLR